MSSPLASRILARIDALRVVSLSRVFGPAYAVRYLRAPRPGSVGRILAGLGARVGTGTTFKGALVLENIVEDAHSAGDLRHLRIGRNCYIGEGVHIDVAHEVTVGDDVVVAGRVSVLTHADCNRSAYLAARYPRVCAPVVVQDGAWLGFGCTIFPGVTIGNESVIAAGTVQREDADPRTVYAGIPGRRVAAVADSPP